MMAEGGAMTGVATLDRPEVAPVPSPAPAVARPRFTWIAVLLPFAVVLAFYAGARLLSPGLPTTYRQLQDRWLLLAQFAGTGLALLPLAWRGAAIARPLAPPRWVVAGLAVAVVALCYAGHYAVLAGYDLSRDEQMATFDARIYAAGRMAWPLPALWQHDANMLNLLFMLPVDHPAAWISGYLPGNSLLRAAVQALLGDQALTSPLLVGASVLLTWGCARRLWPGDSPRDREAAWVAVLALALSGQVILTGMSAFAMTSHLALDLLWLWLFLADRRREDLLCLPVGLLATGLHQPLFHPLFVLPWLVLLLMERRWARLALFALAYLAIGLFWLAWPHVTHTLVSGPLSVTEPTGTDFLSRLTDALAQNKHNLPMMAANLLRFETWQPIPLLALTCVGIGGVFLAPARDRRAAALAAGPILLVAIMTTILPYQGHGFGYRYIHGFLGSLALLAAYGWRRLEPWQARLRPVLLAVMALAALVLLPMQASMAHRLYAPAAEVAAKVGQVDADYIIIGPQDAPFALDLVLNRPDLSNRPLRIAAEEIDAPDPLAARICQSVSGRHPRLALVTESFFTPMYREFRAKFTGKASERLAADIAEFGDAGCDVVVLK